MKKPKHFWLYYIVGLTLISVAAGVFMKFVQHRVWFHPHSIYPIVVILMLSFGMGSLAQYMIKRAEKLSHRQLTRWMIPGLLIFYVSSFLIADLAIAISVVLSYLVNGKEFDSFWHQLFTYELSFANRRLLRWLFFFTISFFYFLWRKSANKEQKLIEENLKYKYNTLKAQVNPHFLFNSLNTLSELVHTNVQKADTFIQKLSGVYRYILENENKDLVSLNNEMDFVQQYFDLQKERAGNKIILNVDVMDPEKIKVMPISVQVLVENALKHNAYSNEKPLVINIVQHDNEIRVSNSIQRKSILDDSTQTGLKNLGERVKMLLNNDLKIQNEEGLFTVILPCKIV